MILDTFETEAVTSGMGAWAEVVGDRKLSRGVVADFGIGEAVIALLYFKDGSIEVGRGEALRPYLRLYAGTDPEEAADAFLNAVNGEG